MNGLSRFLYLLSRSVGDLDAARRGTLGRRLVRRAENRVIWRAINRRRR